MFFKKLASTKKGCKFLDRRKKVFKTLKFSWICVEAFILEKRTPWFRVSGAAALAYLTVPFYLIYK